MSRRQKIFIWVAVGALATGLAARLIHGYLSRIKPVIVAGAVIRRDTDPRKQAPIVDAKVTVVGGTADESASSDVSGFFKVVLHPSVLMRNRPVTLRFEHAGYQPLELTAGAKDLLYVVRMEPSAREPVRVRDHTGVTSKPVRISDVRLRYSVKNETLVSVGSVARQFDVVNAANVPCKGRQPCSPDGKWKASAGTISLDAQKGNEFRNVRASCIAGPCPFTKLSPNDLSKPARRIEITALDWSDTASFLVEAEVTRTMVTDMVRHSYPFIIGPSMSFALPAAAEGPSIIADVNGQEIVFPLGPDLILSWTSCSVEVAQGGNKLYRCDLKPGYQFQP